MKGLINMIDKVWITLNRDCNFNCKWCYGRTIKDACMPLSFAKELIDFSASIGARFVILMGGEPTLYPYFFELLDYIKYKGLKTFMISNGYKFKDIKFVEETARAGIDAVTICLKAANKQGYNDIAGFEAFDGIKEAARNLQEANSIEFFYTTVVSPDNIDNIEQPAKLIAELTPNKLLSYRLCSPVINKDHVDADFVLPRQKMVSIIVERFDEISDILNGNVELRMSYPLCFWPKQFIQKLKSRGQLSTGCLLRSSKRNGITFDVDGSVILCNWFHYYPTAKYGEEFNDKESFEKFWNSEDVKEIYNTLQNQLAVACKDCEDFDECRGGCFTRWLSEKGMLINT